MTINIWTDGSVRPNPGKGGIGIVIQSDSWSYTISEPCAKKVTNNMAEYLAVRRCLEELMMYELTDKEIVIHSDSEMLVEQVNDRRLTTQGGYVPIYKEVMELLKKFKNIKCVWISREENSEANILASKAL